MSTRHQLCSGEAVMLFADKHAHTHTHPYIQAPGHTQHDTPAHTYSCKYTHREKSCPQSISQPELPVSWGRTNSLYIFGICLSFLSSSSPLFSSPSPHPPLISLSNSLISLSSHSASFTLTFCLLVSVSVLSSILPISSYVLTYILLSLSIPFFENYSLCPPCASPISSFPFLQAFDRQWRAVQLPPKLARNLIL